MANIIAFRPSPECEGCGTTDGVKILIIGGLTDITKRRHPICRECAGHIGPMDDETWSSLQGAEAVSHG